MSNKKIGFERVRMIVVERCALFQAKIVSIAVIPIVFEDCDLVVTDTLDDATDNCRFS